MTAHPSSSSVLSAYCPDVPADLAGRVRVEPFPSKAFIWCLCPRGYAVLVTPKNHGDKEYDPMRGHQDGCRGAR